MTKKFACLDNPEQNNWRKLKNPSKFRQGKKSVISTFVFLTAIAKVWFLEGRLGTRLSLFLIYVFIQFWEWLFTFSMLFAEAPASCDQKILKWFMLHCTLICMSSKSVSHGSVIITFKWFYRSLIKAYNIVERMVKLNSKMFNHKILIVFTDNIGLIKY